MIVALVLAMLTLIVLELPTIKVLLEDPLTGNKMRDRQTSLEDATD